MMKSLHLKTIATGLAALLAISGIFANQVLAAGGTPLARVVVAKSGGNYTTITAALNAINPTATNPYVIEVWPGVYTETGTINLKSYVHLKGSGRDVTTVKTSLGTTADVISVNSKTNVTISGLTISGGRYGIEFSRSTSAYSATVTDNTISNNNWFGIGTQCSGFSCSLLIIDNILVANLWGGMDLEYTSATVSQNFISGNGHGMTNNDAGIASDGDNTTPVLVQGNVISGNNGVGIQAWGLHFTISDNIVTGNTLGGVELRDNATADTVTNNKIVNNGGALYKDILLEPGALPNINFNVFDTITGTSGTGSYNVNSTGDPIAVP